MQINRWDVVNRLTKLTNNGNVYTYTYDGNSNLTSVKNGTNTDISVTYNKGNVPTAYSTSYGGRSQSYTMSYYTNGLKYIEEETGEEYYRIYSYDSLGRLEYEGEMHHWDDVYSADYTYDIRGNRSKVIERDYSTNKKAITNYTYDANNRLTGSAKMGNLSFSASSGTVTETAAYTYDDNGNMLTETTNGVTKNYTYDDFNRLITYSSGSTTASYTYSTNNLRASKTVNGTKTTFVWNGQNLASETKSGTTTAYTYDPTGIISSKAGSAALVRFIKDPHGNIVATSQNNSVFGTYDYTAFGKQIEATNTTNPFRYCGEYQDLCSGLIYLRNRYYDPSTGRSISEDPAKDGLNWYVYCENNPIGRIDPTGENWITDKISDACNDAKWAFKTIGNYVNEAQKTAQRKFWKTGSQVILRDNWGYETSAWMLEHSLQDNPSDIWRENDSRIADLVNNDSAYLSELDNAIAKSQNNRLDNYKISVQFNDGDLYYSIHKSDIYLTGYKRNDGKWIINAVLEDEYDFTEIQSFMDDSGGWSKQASKGTAANDLAVISQKTGAINPYHVTVYFRTTR